nr:probable polygalacturonase [Tanacetum cinerariifolium]
NIPASNNTFPTILTKFKLEGLDVVAFVALSDTFRGKVLQSSWESAWATNNYQVPAQAIHMARGGEEGEYHPLIEPSPLYGRGRDGLGGWFSSLIGGSHLTDVVISGSKRRRI